MPNNWNEKRESCFVLFSREMDKNARKLIHQFDGKYTSYILTYDDQGAEKNEVQNGIRHVLYNRKSLEKLFGNSTPKFHNNGWKIMPGNLDLCQLLFVHQFCSYRYYWFCEDDVRYTGDIATFISNFHECQDDLLVTNYRKMNANWSHRHTYASPVPNSMSDKLVFLPFFRISNQAAQDIITAYANGWSGHCEICWPSILSYYGRSITDINIVVKGCYSSSPQKKGMGPGSFIYEPPKLFPGVRRNTLYHPVKSYSEYRRRMTSRIKRMIKNSFRR